MDFGDVQFEDDEDDENVVSLEKLKTSIMGPEPELQFDKGLYGFQMHITDSNETV